jgi:hypothetical protein
MLHRLIAILFLASSVALGQGVQGVLQKSKALKLTDSQQQIRVVLSKTAKEYNELLSQGQGKPDL